MRHLGPLRTLSRLIFLPCLCRSPALRYQVNEEPFPVSLKMCDYPPFPSVHTVTWVNGRNSLWRSRGIIIVFTCQDVAGCFFLHGLTTSSVSKFKIWKLAHVWELSKVLWLLIGVSTLWLLTLFIFPGQCPLSKSYQFLKGIYCLGTIFSILKYNAK